MADNTRRYGFRWSTSANGSFNPPMMRMFVDTTVDWQDGSANSVNLHIGDPVNFTSSGGIALADTTEAIAGVVAGFLPVYDPTDGVLKPTDKVTNQLSWGSNEENRPFAMVIPAEAGIFEVDCDDATTATTRAAYQALVNENVTHVNPGDTTAVSADPMLDISTHATTAGLSWRIVGISGTVFNEDFSGNYVKLLVRANLVQHAGAPASGSLVSGV